MPSFKLHERLAADSVAVEDWPLSRVFLARDANYPWLILVPRRAALSDYHDLAPADLAIMNDEIVRASRALVALYAPDKVNVAALGNMVPQLHVHVVARFRDDPAWPAPIWGSHAAQTYAPAALDARIADLRRIFTETATTA